MTQRKESETHVLEQRLREHYRRAAADPRPDEVQATAAAMLEADRAHGTLPADPIGTVAFVARQARTTPWWVWAVQGAFLLLAVLITGVEHNAAFACSTMGALSSMTVMMSASVVHASRTYRMSEIESSCRYDSASVTVARMIILGCSQALCMAVAAAEASSAYAQGFVAPFLYVCLPYFCSCAGSLLLLRRFNTRSSLPWCGAWVLCCCGASFLLGARTPFVYEAASVGVWAVAAAVAIVWLLCEARRTVDDARTGAAVLDAKTLPSG